MFKKFRKSASTAIRKLGGGKRQREILSNSRKNLKALEEEPLKTVTQTVPSLWNFPKLWRLIMSASHTCLYLFEKIPVLEPILWSNVQQTFPVNSLNEASIDFQIETDWNIFFRFLRYFPLQNSNSLKMVINLFRIETICIWRTI